MNALGAKGRDTTAIERDLAAAQQKFLAQVEKSAKKQGLGDAGNQQMAAAMSEMADLHDELSTVSAARDSELSQAEAEFYAEIADLERNAVTQAKKKGAFGQLRDAFWEVVNKLATKPTQGYFNRKPKNQTAPKLPRFGETELSEITKVARPGDIILWGGQTTFVHGSIYIGNGEIVHALANNTPIGPEAQGVFRESIKQYMIRCERNRAAVVRVKGFSEADNQATIAFGLKQLGKPYDNVFRTQDLAAFYCTELTFHALKHGANAPKIGTRKKVMGLFTIVTTDDIRLSPDMETLWSKNTPEVVPAGE
jgi:hypothetical protein